MQVKKKNRKKVPDLFLEEFALSEMSDLQIRNLDITELEARRTEIEESNREILDRLPPERIVPSIRSRYAIETSKRKRNTQRKVYLRRTIAIAFAPTVAVAAFLLWSQPNLDHPIHPNRSNPSYESVRIKGLKPHLAVYRKSGKGVEQLSPDSIVKSGDLIQLAYIASGHAYGVIFSIDGAGNVSLHFPQHTSGKTLLEPRKETLLQQSYELDRAPLFERFFFVTAHRPIDVQKVLDSAKELATTVEKAETSQLSLPAGWQQTSFKLVKVNP